MNGSRSGVVAVFSEVLGVDPETLNDDSSPETVSQWDSVAVMELVAAIEERFGVELSTREIMAMRTIGLVRSVLRRKGIEDA